MVRRIKSNEAYERKMRTFLPNSSFRDVEVGGVTRLIRSFSRQDIDDLWSDLIGSRRIFPTDEVKAINELKNSRAVSQRVAYQLYFSSRFWRMLRKRVLVRDGFACVQCKSKYLVHVDHLRYPGIGVEELDDLQTLCAYCHAKKTKAYDLLGNKTLKKDDARMTASKQLYTVLR
jgi:5-methylcytosine-specific restriction endonuclease McrA